MEQEAQTATEQAEERSKAIGASAEVVAASEQAQREAANRSISAAELVELHNAEQILRKTQLSRMKVMVRANAR